MKFVIIQSAEAYHHELEQIFRDIKINSYSELPVDGFMESADGNSDISNWFGSSKNPYRYFISFTFLDEEKADELLARVKAFNEETEGVSPLSAFISAIEKFV
ncbi:hypothetical protein [Draconibacterium halophilum]|uniref:DUF3240 domain-containing protein n=1 Tax=Draconibacterium halophilum TaxID=2706887 RepID=A0A6C0RFT3_9BACT|nr:hypothetical protein [Draconibacterium halophilum]QIA08383.1 hypothetical protein G0Q07_11965 [Draconibacterium halophilum]